jgi:DNA primase
MQENWVDFKAIKAAVTMQALLDRYQINWLRKSGEELRGRCPIHQGDGANAFHANLDKHAFNCFSCKARGNVLDFVAAMEKCSVRDAALKLQDWYSVPGPVAGDTEKVEPAKRGVGESETNKPLSFQLKGIDHAHPYLAERGITEETAGSFGVGYFGGKGSMHGRIVIPIHNERGELVAYAGRAIDGTEPRYKLPLGFHKSLELFNLHRAVGESNLDRRVVVVEGFFDCLQVTRAGVPCVALMGSSMSEAQEELLANHFESAWLMLDGDEAGRNGTGECLTRLGRRMWVRSARVPDGKQPDQLSGEELKGLLEK